MQIAARRQTPLEITRSRPPPDILHQRHRYGCADGPGGGAEGAQHRRQNAVVLLGDRSEGELLIGRGKKSDAGAEQSQDRADQTQNRHRHPSRRSWRCRQRSNRSRPPPPTRHRSDRPGGRSAAPPTPLTAVGSPAGIQRLRRWRQARFANRAAPPRRSDCGAYD